jgi:putative peptidoglycan lipid II flippase
MLKSFATVSGLTMVSRLLGFVRDQLIAFTLGTGFVAEAFFVAQRFPNLFRALFAEGAFNNAFVPQYARRVEGDGFEAAWRFAQAMFSVMFAWLTIFCTACMILMPWVIYVFAWNFHGTPEALELTVELTRICFPYLLFISLAALQAGVLNSLNRFTAAAAAPILLNITLIASNLLAWYFGTGSSPDTGRIFAAGVTFSGIAQFALLAIACRRAGVALLPGLPKLTPEVKKVLRLTVPGLVSGGIMQINLLIATGIAYGIPGAVAYLYYADRLYQLPLGVIIVAIGVVLLPDLSRRLRAGDEAGALASANRALEISLFLTIPAAVALIVIPHEIIRALFQHGAFKASDTAAVAQASIAFAAGLPAYAMTKVFQPSFYAREDTATPMRFAIASVIVNIGASVLLAYYVGHWGIAAATSVAAWTNAVLLGATLYSRGHFRFDERFKSRGPRIIVSAIAMGGVLAGLSHYLSSQFADGTSIVRMLVALAALVLAGVITYFAASLVSGAMRMGEIRAALKR